MPKKFKSLQLKVCFMNIFKCVSRDFGKVRPRHDSHCKESNTDVYNVYNNIYIIYIIISVGRQD